MAERGVGSTGREKTELRDGMEKATATRDFPVIQRRGVLFICFYIISLFFFLGFVWAMGFFDIIFVSRA